MMLHATKKISCGSKNLYMLIVCDLQLKFN